MSTRLLTSFRDVTPGVCQSLQLPVGTLVLYTARAPYKTGDTPNEDGLAVLEVDPANYVLVVADGVGGSPGGATASAIVLEKVVECVSGEPEASAIPAMLIAAIEDADQEIKSRGNGSASTVVLAHIDADTFRTVHVGDSVVLQCGQRGKLKFETIAHSPVGYALEAGVLSEDEAFSHEDRHVVSNIVGGQDMSITLGGAVPLARRDTLMLATDGVTDNVRQSEIIEIIRKGPVENCAERLVELAEERMESPDEGKPDDMTFILFRRAGVQ